MKNDIALPDPEKMSERLLRERSLSAVPVDIEQVLQIWNDLELVHEDLDGSGYLLPLGKLGAEIIVNQKDPVERRRFTIAHELGHWILGQICKKKSGEFQQPQGISYSAIEKWCDHFAANLLMPRSLMEQWLSKRNDPLFIDKLLRGSSAFKVSEEAFFIRAWELLHIQVVRLKSLGFNHIRKLEVDRNYGGEQSVRLLDELLKIPSVDDQLNMRSPVIFFSGKIKEYRLNCSGRRLASNLLMLCICWEPVVAVPQNAVIKDQFPSVKS